MESSIINSTMLIQIAILAWIFLGERVNWQEGIGMALAAAGVMIVQIRKKS
ncbi:MAG: EamA family transporter [Anaerolineales bacterium]